MRLSIRVGLLRLVALAAAAVSLAMEEVHPQDLAPRAYLITPIRSNAVTLTYAFIDGNLNLDGSVPITDSKARVNMPVASYVRSLNAFGRSANILVALPYGTGKFEGKVGDVEANVHRSGLGPVAIRFAMNLWGGPAMDIPRFIKWKQKWLVGTSIKVLPPTGQYDPTKLINLGINRWAFKPEVGVSRRWSHWIVDAYGGAWLYTTNDEFFSNNAISPGVNRQTQDAMGSFEGHVSYDVKQRLWASFDANYWFGGATSINGVLNPLTSNRNSRIGGTVSLPVSKRQSLKLSYSDGAYIRYGGNFQNVSVAWQYSWVTRR